MAVVDVQSKAQWVSLLKDAPPAVAFFWADWHEPSKPKGQMDAVFTHLASLHPGVRFLRVEAEAVPEVSVLFGVAVVPTFVCLRGGPEAVADKLEGAHPAELGKKVQALAASAGSSAGGGAGAAPVAAVAVNKPTEQEKGAAAAAKGDLEERLKRLITAAPVVLFMKGSPAQPRCGFSNKMVDLLKGEGIGFASFDVFSDEEVRQGLKAYSNWPTYPQLYVHGELVGGLDILQEMKAEGGGAPLKEQLGLRDLPANQPHQELTSSSAGAGGSGGGGLEARLEALIKRAPVMLFMKGSADAPKCGFSNKMVDLLREAGAAFDTFDILTDEEVRQGLKTYSNWPTYPQLYVDGELVGGLDIVREMKENGELDAVLKGSS